MFSYSYPFVLFCRCSQQRHHPPSSLSCTHHSPKLSVSGHTEKPKARHVVPCTSTDAQLRLGPGRGYTERYLERRQIRASACARFGANKRFSHDSKSLASSDPCVVRKSNQGVPCKRSKQCAPSVYFVIHELHHIQFFFSPLNLKILCHFSL